MIFSPPLYGKVLRSEKTQTRRLMQSGDLATKYRTGMRRAVQKGRGDDIEAHIILTDVRRELLGAIDFDAARAEGFTTVQDFKAYWLGLHDVDWVKRQRLPDDPEDLVALTDEQIQDRFYQRWAFKEVWVLTFEIDRTEQPQLLMQGSPLTDGGKARLMSNRKVKPRDATAREVTGPEEHGYTASPARAMPHEPEPVDAQLQQRFSKEGHQGFVAREKQREIDRERLAVHDRLQRVQVEARAAGVDIVQFELGILQRLRAAERKIHQRKTA